MAEEQVQEEQVQNVESLEQRVEAAAKVIGNIDEERSAYNQSVGNLVELVEQSVRQKQAESDRHEAIVKEILAENERLKEMIGRLLSAAEMRPTSSRSGEVSEAQERLSHLLESANINASAEAESTKVVSISEKLDENKASEDTSAGPDSDAEETNEADDTEAAVLAAMNGALAAMNETGPGAATASEATQPKSKRAKGGGSWFGS